MRKLFWSMVMLSVVVLGWSQWRISADSTSEWVHEYQRPSVISNLEVSDKLLLAAQSIQWVVANPEVSYAAAQGATLKEDQVFSGFLEAMDPDRSFITRDQALSWKNDFDWTGAFGGVDYTTPLRAYEEFFTVRSNRVEWVIQQIKSESFLYRVGIFNSHPLKDRLPHKELDEWWLSRLKNEFNQLKIEKFTREAALDRLMLRYQTFLKTNSSPRGDEAMEWWINAYASSFDPHSAYMAPVNAQFFKDQMSLAMYGIGARIEEELEGFVVQEIVEGGAAYQHGNLRTGDRIVGVSQDGVEWKNINGWRLEELVQFIRGPKNSSIFVKIVREGQSLPYLEFKRAPILQPDAMGLQSKIIDGPHRQIGWLSVPSFYTQWGEGRSVSDDVEQALVGFKKSGVDAVILDLRANGGGSLREAVDLTGLFIKTGPVVQIKSVEGDVQIESDKNQKVGWDGPLVVWVDGASASASELVSGALQDYGRALIVGEKTFGKGSVQVSIKLGRAFEDMGLGHGVLNLTTDTFFRPLGGAIQLQGVLPDVLFEMDWGGVSFKESDYNNALGVEAIQAFDVPHRKNIDEKVDRVRTKDAKWVQSSHQWRWFEALQEHYKKRQKNVELDTAKRLAQHAEWEHQRKKLEREASHWGYESWLSTEASAPVEMGSWASSPLQERVVALTEAWSAQHE